MRTLPYLEQLALRGHPQDLALLAMLERIAAVAHAYAVEDREPPLQPPYSVADVVRHAGLVNEAGRKAWQAARYELLRQAAGGRVEGEGRRDQAVEDAA